MSGKRRVLLGSVTAIALVAVAMAVYLGREQLMFGDATDVSILPQFVSPVGEDGNPLNVLVGFTWTQNGYCTGQFHVKVSETTTQVRVGAVISRTYSRGTCAGMGTDGKWAWAPLTLASPIGSRLVVRDSDGVALPIFAPASTLGCKDVINSEVEPPAGQSVIFGAVGLPHNALQANYSGETDPSAHLFAKTGLNVAALASL